MITINKDSANEHQIKCGSLHGAPHLASPTLKSYRQFYWGNIGETELYGGQGGRIIHVNCLLNDLDWSDSANVYSYLKSGLDPRIGVNGTLSVTHPDGSTSEFSYCTFERWVPKPQPGHELAAPLKDLAGSIQLNRWWLEVDLFFYQLQSNSVFIGP